MDSGTSMIFGVATSDSVRRVYNAVISTGREARDIATVNTQYGWTEINRWLVERLELIANEIIDPINRVADARQLVRRYIDRCNTK